MRALLITLLLAGLSSALLPASATAQQLDLAQGPITVEAEEELSPAEAMNAWRESQRSPRLAFAMTPLVPGWGQLYADAPFWAAVGFAVEMYYLGNILLERRRLERQKVARDRETDPEQRDFRTELVVEHRERARDASWWAGGAALILGIDAWVSVELAGFDDPGVPVPDLDSPWNESEPTAADGASPMLALHLRF